MDLPVFSRFAGPNWEQESLFSTKLPWIDRHFTMESEQHPMRRWEYALAMAARDWWFNTTICDTHSHRVLRALDVGGAGSPLRHILNTMIGKWEPIEVIDPAVNFPIERYQDSAVDCVFSISVLEHVEDPYDFLGACIRPLRSGGLLFLTMDAWDPPVETAKDTAHFHWMRKRIFTKTTVNHIMDTLCRWGMRPFGGIDLEYKGNTVYDYTFASVCMTKGE